MSRRDCFHGMTLIELLVTIAIIGILLGITLPAVQAGRAAADRIACSNNVRQLAMALHSFHDVQGHLPAGTSVLEVPMRPWESWHTRILPYVEQQALYDLSESFYSVEANPFTDVHRPARAAALVVFSCPTDSRTHYAQVATWTREEIALTSYLGVNGADMTAEDGCLYRDSRIRFGDIRDGLSNTVMIGERPPSIDLQYGWRYAGYGLVGTGALDSHLGMEEVLVGDLRYATGLCSRTGNAFSAGDLVDYCHVLHFWSLHSSGAVFAFADGSTRFITYGDRIVMRSMATRSGGWQNDL